MNILNELGAAVSAIGKDVSNRVGDSISEIQSKGVAYYAESMEAVNAYSYAPEAFARQYSVKIEGAGLSATATLEAELSAEQKALGMQNALDAINEINKLEESSDKQLTELASEANMRKQEFVERIGDLEDFFAGAGWTQPQEA